MDEVQVDSLAPRTVIAADTTQVKYETAERQRSAVSLYVSAFALVAAVSFSWVTYHDGVSLSWALLAFILLATLADLREVRLPGVGVVGMSFVPAMAALIVLGLWPAMVVAIVSGATSAGFTRDPQKIAFNVSNYVVSTFVAGIVFLALVPEGGGLAAQIVPAFAATAVDFLANTAALAMVVAMSTGRHASRRVAPELRMGAARISGRGHLRPHRGLAVRTARCGRTGPGHPPRRPHLLLLRGLCRQGA